jgi:hypothetical protein
MAPSLVAFPKFGAGLRSWQVDLEPESSFGASSTLFRVAAGSEGLRCWVKSLVVLVM